MADRRPESNRHTANGTNGTHDRDPAAGDDTSGEWSGTQQQQQQQQPDLEMNASALNHKTMSARQRILRVTWAWFPCTMSTGALASLLSVQGYTFPGLTTIGKVVYILTIVLFAAFTILIAIRFIHKPRALSTSLHHPSESFFFGAFWVTVALIINGAQAYGFASEAALRGAFWWYIACALIVAVFQYHVIFEVERLPTSEAVPAWILPAYPFLVTGTVAGTVAGAQSDPANAVPFIVAGLMGQGLGWILALFIYVVYLTRLIGHNVPPPSTRPGMYVSVGPAAYTCAGLLALGKQAGTVLPDDFGGLPSGAVPAGAIWQAASVPAAAFLWLLAVWFSALTTVSILRQVRRMSFTLNWWAFVFPNAGLGIATINLGEAVGAGAMKAVGSGITIVLVCLWLMCAVAHARALWRGDVLAVGKDVGVDEVNRQHEVKAERKRQGTNLSRY